MRNFGIALIGMGALACSIAIADSTPPGAKPRPKIHEPAIHRAHGDTCTVVANPGQPVASFTGCKSDAECTAGKNGRCNRQAGYYRSNSRRRRGPPSPPSAPPPPPSANSCTYDECFVDGDCPAKAICNCGPPNSCSEPGNCRVDRDCGAHGFCSPSDGLFYCHTRKDTCTEDSDCRKEAFCAYAIELGRWRCFEVDPTPPPPG